MLKEDIQYIYPHNKGIYEIIYCMKYYLKIYQPLSKNEFYAFAINNYESENQIF